MMPESFIFPIHSDKVLGSPQDLESYIGDLVFQLQRFSEITAEAINGTFQSNAGVQTEKWNPVLKGTTSDGTGTYTHQIGWSFRQGILVDVWFDILWTAHTGTGNIYVELPYLVANSSQKPFIGTSQIESINYGAGRTQGFVNAIPNTYRGEMWTAGSATTGMNIAFPNNGHWIGHVRYIGVEDERA